MFCPGYVPLCAAASRRRTWADWPLLQSLIGAANAWRNAERSRACRTRPNVLARVDAEPVRGVELEQLSRDAHAGSSRPGRHEPRDVLGARGDLSGSSAARTVLAVTDVGLNFGTGGHPRDGHRVQRAERERFGAPVLELRRDDVLFGVTQASLSSTAAPRPCSASPTSGRGDAPVARPLRRPRSLRDRILGERDELALPLHVPVRADAALLGDRGAAEQLVLRGDVSDGGRERHDPRDERPHARRDDVSAISNGYPTASYLANLGTISGTISNSGSPFKALRSSPSRSAARTSDSHGDAELRERQLRDHRTDPRRLLVYVDRSTRTRRRSSRRTTGTTSRNSSFPTTSTSEARAAPNACP